MKAKHLFVAIAAPLAAGGLWFAGSAWRAGQSASYGFKTAQGLNFDRNTAASSPRASHLGAGPSNRPNSGQMLHTRARLAPPDLSRRFTDFTPEQRVEFAREGHGPGG